MLPLLGAGAALDASRPPRPPAAGQPPVLAASSRSRRLLSTGPTGTARRSLWIGAWPETLGICLVADRLSALMLLVSAVVTLAVLVYSIGQGMTGDERRRR